MPSVPQRHVDRRQQRAKQNASEVERTLLAVSAEVAYFAAADEI